MPIADADMAGGRNGVDRKRALDGVAVFRGRDRFKAEGLELAADLEVDRFGQPRRGQARVLDAEISVAEAAPEEVAVGHIVLVTRPFGLIADSALVRFVFQSCTVVLAKSYCSL